MNALSGYSTHGTACPPYSCKRLAVLITAAALTGATPASAADWTLKLSMNLAESYSDNIRMAAPGRQQSDWVTQVNPGMTLDVEGPRLKLSTHYQMQNQFYLINRQQNSTKHQLTANAHTELINDQLFMDGSASIGQQAISALGAQALNNINITANRADIVTLTLSPYLAHRFGSDADGEIRYTQSQFNSNAAGLANSQTGRLSLKLDSGEAFKSLGWSFNYSRQQASYSNYLRPINNENYSGNVSYQITPRFTLNAVAGYEKSDYVSIGKVPVGAIYTAGFSWEPSSRTTLQASAGQRYFGNNFSLNAKHRTRRTTWNLTYSEDITTTQAQFLANATNPAQAQAGPVNLLSNQVFLQKRLQSSVTLNGKRNTVTFTLYDALRNAQTPQNQNLALLGAANLALGNNSQQLGGNLFWSSKITPYTTANLSLGYAVNTFPGITATSYDRNFLFGITSQLQSKLNSHFEWRHNQRTSNLANSDYMENALSASLMMQF